MRRAPLGRLSAILRRPALDGVPEGVLDRACHLAAVEALVSGATVVDEGGRPRPGPPQPPEGDRLPELLRRQRRDPACAPVAPDVGDALALLEMPVASQARHRPVSPVGNCASVQA